MFRMGDGVAEFKRKDGFLFRTRLEDQDEVLRALREALRAGRCGGAAQRAVNTPNDAHSRRHGLSELWDFPFPPYDGLSDSGAEIRD